MQRLTLVGCSHACSLFAQHVAAGPDEDRGSEHPLSRKWLPEKRAEVHAGPTLIVTQHVPHLAAEHRAFGYNTFSPAFCSDGDDVIAAASAGRTVAWIFGHHHWNQ